MLQLKFRAVLLSTSMRVIQTPPFRTQLYSCRCFTSSNFIEYPPLRHHTQWSGLQKWRASPLNRRRIWGSDGPEEDELNGIELRHLSSALDSCASLTEMGSVVLSTADPVEKAKLSHLAYSRWRQERQPIGVCDAPSEPARPEEPRLVSFKEISSPKDLGLPLNAYMLHNLAHVELNAIDLAWDTVVRFSSHTELLSEGFFSDFAHVADDESRHFLWCSQRYGDMPAHGFLWRECAKTSDNVAARIAVIPLVQEARGLDAGPRLVNKLTGFGDHRTSHIVAKIANEEVAHVAVGVYWFVSLCETMGHSPHSSFAGILREYNVELKGPFNHAAREEAGIPRVWYDPTSKTTEEAKLSEVYDRLASFISVEKENTSL